MQFFKIDEQEIVHITQIKKLFPNMSFPTTGPDDVWLDANGYARFVYEVMPEPIDMFHTVVLDGFKSNQDGSYAHNWIQLELDVNAKWNIIRSIRDQKLGEVMWRYERYTTQIAGGFTPSDTAQWIQDLLTYIQLLRDITTSAPTPEEVVWPPIPVTEE